MAACMKGAAMNTHDQTNSAISRRHLLRAAAGAGVAAILAACGGGTATSPPSSGQATASPAAPVSGSASAPTARSATAGGAATATGGTAIVISTSSVPLSTDKLSLHWVQSGPGPKGLFFKAYFAAYSQAHPNITIQLDELPWPEIGKIVPLGVQNSNAPDVFQIPQNFTGGQAVSQGWVRPLDDLIPNFAQWKAAFPPGSFLDGVHIFNGKTYTFPFITNKLYGTLLLSNVDVTRAAGVDTQTKPLMWDEYRAAAKKITQQGGGKYYGAIFEGAQTSNWETDVRNLARMAGASGGGDDLDYKTGEYHYTADQYLAAIDLLLALKADGSVFPGTLSLNAQQARAQMAQGVAGLMIQGPWNIEQWKTTSPNFAFDVASLPVPNTGAPMPLTYEPTGGYLWLYAKTKYPEVASDLLTYLGTEQGQAAYVALSGGGEPAVFPQANQLPSLDPRIRKVNTLFDQQMRLGPSPSVRNPDVEKVNLERKTVTPDFGSVVQGIYTGQISDAKKAMQDLKDRSDKELDRAIKAAQAKGAKVSRDDYVFPNWDPTKDYTTADYAALKK